MEGNVAEVGVRPEVVVLQGLLVLYVLVMMAVSMWFLVTLPISVKPGPVADMHARGVIATTNTVIAYSFLHPIDTLKIVGIFVAAAVVSTVKKEVHMATDDVLAAGH